METDHEDEPQGWSSCQTNFRDLKHISALVNSCSNVSFADRAAANVNSYSQHHPSNWVGAGDDEEDEDEDEMYVQSTPHYDD